MLHSFIVILNQTKSGLQSLQTHDSVVSFTIEVLKAAS